jgi:hypothetical protein
LRVADPGRDRRLYVRLEEALVIKGSGRIFGWIEE